METVAQIRKEAIANIERITERASRFILLTGGPEWIEKVIDRVEKSARYHHIVGASGGSGANAIMANENKTPKKLQKRKLRPVKGGGGSSKIPARSS